MALFQKKPLAGTSVPLYTLGQNKTVLIVGLGNTGKDYDGTRHNIGFACLDAFVAAHDFSGWVAKKDLKSAVATATMGQTRVIAIKPQTFMNLSGEAVQAVVHFYKIPPNQIVIIHDELDIPFGQIRLRVGGGSAGHNGIKSIITQMGEPLAEQLGRIRIGISNDLAAKLDSADFVLQKFTAEEQAQTPNLTREVTSILSEYLYGTKLPPETRNFIV